MLSGDVGTSVLTIAGGLLSSVSEVRFLGSVVSASGSLGGEVEARVRSARAAFGSLGKGLWRRRDVSLAVKVSVYCSLVRGSLLYACETWCALRADLHRLGVFERRCLRELVGASRLDRVSNDELYRRCGLDCRAEEPVTRARWRWLGHVLRMGPSRLPRRLLDLDYDSLGCRRPRGGPRRTWRRVVINEAWDAIGSGKRPCSYDRWVSGRWREWLSRLATDRQAWREFSSRVEDMSAHSR